MNSPFTDPLVSDIENFSKAFLRIYDKNKEIVPFVFNPIQQDISNKIKAGRNRIVVIKSRQQGVTTLASALIYRQAITQKSDHQVLTYHQSATEDLRVLYANFRSLMETLPKNYHKYIPAIDRDSREIIRYTDTNSTIKIGTANGRGQKGRGSTLSTVHFTEACFVSEAQRILNGAMQAVPKDSGLVIIESTTNGASGYVYDLVQEIMDIKDRGKTPYWELLFYEWFRLPEYKIRFTGIDHKQEFIEGMTEEETYVMQEHNLSYEQMLWRNLKIQEIGRVNFQQEYPENIHTAFISTGAGFFQNVRNFENLFCAPRNQLPEPHHNYVAGIDWGLQGDPTAISVIDATTGREVDLQRFKATDWNDILDNIVYILKKWNVGLAYVERNSIGNLLDVLWDRITSENVRTDIQTVYMTNRRKQELATLLHHTMDEGRISFLPDPLAIKEFRGFIVVNLQTTWTVKNPNGHDDTVVARMLANLAKEQNNTEMMWVF